MKIFLGGAIHSNWRDETISFLKYNNIDYFNPVVESWNADARAIEEKERYLCNYIVIYISPDMRGFYSIFEIGMLCHLFPRKLILVYNLKSEYEFKIFSKEQYFSLLAIEEYLKDKNIPCLNGIFKLKEFLLKRKELLSDV